MKKKMNITILLFPIFCFIKNNRKDLQFSQKPFYKHFAEVVHFSKYSTNFLTIFSNIIIMKTVYLNRNA